MVMTRNLDGATIGKFSRSLVIFFFSQLNVLLDINLFDTSHYSYFMFLISRTSRIFGSSYWICKILYFNSAIMYMFSPFGGSSLHFLVYIYYLCIVCPPFWLIIASLVIYQISIYVFELFFRTIHLWIISWSLHCSWQSNILI